MTDPERRPLQIPADHPAAPAVRRAERHYERQDSAACDKAWVEAVRLAGPPLRSELATRHVARLVNLRDHPRAKSRCDAYLEGHEGRNLPLSAVRQPVPLVQGKHDDATNHQPDQEDEPGDGPELRPRPGAIRGDCEHRVAPHRQEPGRRPFGPATR